MQFDSMFPIWIQVANMLKGEIMTGRLKPGEKLPSGRELALRCSINPNTAMRVLKEMETEKLCFTKRGLGTFVTEDPARLKALQTEMAENVINAFFTGMEQIGIDREEAVRRLMEERNYAGK